MLGDSSVPARLRNIYKSDQCMVFDGCQFANEDTMLYQFCSILSLLRRQDALDI